RGAWFCLHGGDRRKAPALCPPPLGAPPRPRLGPVLTNRGNPSPSRYSEDSAGNIRLPLHCRQFCYRPYLCLLCVRCSSSPCSASASTPLWCTPPNRPPSAPSRKNSTSCPSAN